jgi:hypothetical protein
MRYLQKQVLLHHRSKRSGGKGGQNIPSFIVPLLFISSPDKRNSTKPFLIIFHFVHEREAGIFLLMSDDVIIPFFAPLYFLLSGLAVLTGTSR